MLVWKGGSKGRLEGCEIWGNSSSGCIVYGGGDPTLVGCTIRDHSVWTFTGSGCGLYVRTDAAGKATATDCVFARNAGGDVVREPPQQAWKGLLGLAAFVLVWGAAAQSGPRKARALAVGAHVDPRGGGAPGGGGRPSPPVASRLALGLP